MRRPLMLVLPLLAAALCWRAGAAEEEARVRALIHDWAPLVWLAPGERFLPLGVPEFLDNMEPDNNYLRTRSSLQSLLQNRSSFLHGRKPAGNVPIYALVKSCAPPEDEEDEEESSAAIGNLLVDDFGLKTVETNDVPGSLEVPDFPAQRRRLSRSRTAGEVLPSRGPKPTEAKRRKLSARPLHFHVTYWMFYPFSEGKAVCVLDLGFFGSWPIPSIAGVCLGRLKEYGSHVGDWEHVSLYFKGKDHPLAMYVSAHDAGAFYRYEPRSGSFAYESQETRKGGYFQKPTFPERVRTALGSHPVLFSARGSHGLWTAPGRHRFVRLPRLYDESGFGEAWPTWRRLELLADWQASSMPGWMTYTGRWGNAKSNCHPLARLGFNICEFVDGPTGIPMKKMNFEC